MNQPKLLLLNLDQKQLYPIVQRANTVVQQAAQRTQETGKRRGGIIHRPDMAMLPPIRPKSTHYSRIAGGEEAFNLPIGSGGARLPPATRPPAQLQATDKDACGWYHRLDGRH